MKREQTDAATREAGEATAGNYNRMPTTSVHRSAKRTRFSETTDRDLYYLPKEQPATTNSISLTNDRYSWLSLTKKIIYFSTRRVFLHRKPPVLNGPEQKTNGSLQKRVLSLHKIFRKQHLNSMQDQITPSCKGNIIPATFCRQGRKILRAEQQIRYGTFP